MASSFDNALDSFPTWVDKRSSGASIVNEQHTIPSSSPFEYYLTEVPDSTITVTISGSRSYTYQSTSPTASGQFTVDFTTGKVTHYSGDAADVVRVTYTGTGSAVTAQVVNNIQSAVSAIESVVGLGAKGSSTSLGARIQSVVGICEVYATTPATKQVNISAGWAFPRANARYSLATYLMDFRAGGTHVMGGMTAAFYRRVIITVRERGEVALYQGNAAASSTNALDPIPPSYAAEVPLASILIRQLATAVPGDIDNVYNTDITDWRPFLTSKALDSGMDASLRTLSVKDIYQTDGYWSLNQFGDVDAKVIVLTTILGGSKAGDKFSINAQGDAKFRYGDFSGPVSAKELYLRDGNFAADATGKVTLVQANQRDGYFSVSQFGTGTFKNLISTDATLTRSVETYATIQAADAQLLRARKAASAKELYQEDGLWGVDLSGNQQSVNLNVRQNTSVKTLYGISGKWDIDDATGNIRTRGNVDGVRVSTHVHDGSATGGSQVAHSSLTGVTPHTHHYQFEGQIRSDRLEYGIVSFASETRKDVTFSRPFTSVVKSVLVCPAAIITATDGFYVDQYSDRGFSIYSLNSFAGSVSWMAVGYSGWL